MASSILRVLLLLCGFLVRSSWCWTEAQYWEADNCENRYFGADSFVCMCKSDHCDTISSLGDVAHRTFVTYTSTAHGMRFKKSFGHFGSGPFAGRTELEEEIKRTGIGARMFFLQQRNALEFRVQAKQKRQEMIGFGGAITDTAAMNIMALSEGTRRKFMEAYFSPQGGIEYSVLRVPMGGSDFSNRTYTYADSKRNDFDLDNFALQHEDIGLKIPFIKEAQKLVDPSKGLKLFSSPWSAPAWMKTNDNIAGKGVLKGPAGGKYYQTWADYFVKFFREYERHNVSFWATTVQNEPVDGLVADFPFNCLGYKPADYKTFIEHNLGPTLVREGYGDLKVIIGDDVRPALKEFCIPVLKDYKSARYVDGIGVHWYFNAISAPSVLDQLHSFFPRAFILSTEASEGMWPWEKIVSLGSWKRAENYVTSIIEDVTHWSSGWIDWNLAVDMSGGPNWSGNHLDSPILVDIIDDVIYKQPMFYAMGHFSKFVPPGSRHIEMIGGTEQVRGVAFVREKDKLLVGVFINKLDIDIPVKISDRGETFHLLLPKKSIQTVIWRDFDSM